MATQTITADQFKAAVRCTWSEAEFQRHITALARLHGWRVASFRAVRVQRKSGDVYHETPVGADGKGFPDMFLIHRTTGRMVAAELKVGKNVPTEEQAEWLAALTRAGVECHVWRAEMWDLIEATLTKE